MVGRNHRRGGLGEGIRRKEEPSGIRKSLTRPVPRLDDTNSGAGDHQVQAALTQGKNPLRRVTGQKPDFLEKMSALRGNQKFRCFGGECCRCRCHDADCTPPQGTASRKKDTQAEFRMGIGFKQNQPIRTSDQVSLPPSSPAGSLSAPPSSFCRWSLSRQRRG